MSIASVQHTLTAIGSSHVPSESLTTPPGKTLDRMLNIITTEIYGAYKQGIAAKMKNDLVDLGRAVMKWDPDCPKIPVQLKPNGQGYDIFDVPDAGMRLQEYPGGRCKDIHGGQPPCPSESDIFRADESPGFFGCHGSKNA